MDIEVNILNERYAGSDELLVYQHSGGSASDAPTAVQRAMEENDESFDTVTNGEWIVVVDGEVVQIGHHCPFYIEVE